MFSRENSDSHTSDDAIIASIDQDFVDVAKELGYAAAAMRSPFPNGPPMLGQSVPDAPPT